MATGWQAMEAVQAGNAGGLGRQRRSPLRSSGQRDMQNIVQSGAVGSVQSITRIPRCCWRKSSSRPKWMDLREPSKNCVRKFSRW